MAKLSDCVRNFEGNVQRPIRKHFSRTRNMPRSHEGSTLHAAFFRLIGSESLGNALVPFPFFRTSFYLSRRWHYNSNAKYESGKRYTAL